MRLPEGFAIELALVHGIPRDVLREVMTGLNRTWQLNLQGLDTADEKKLQVTAVEGAQAEVGAACPVRGTAAALITAASRHGPA